MADETYDNYCLIPHPREPRLLLIASDAGWTLPRHVETQPAGIAAAIRASLGLDVTVLRCAYNRARYEPDAHSQVYEMENHSPTWRPPEHAAWVGSVELAGLELAVPEHRAVLGAWLREAKGGAVPEQRAAWALQGWWAEATAWIGEQAKRTSYALAGRIVQVKICSWSAVLRVHTQTGDLYFKATAPAAAFEPSVTAALAERVPEHSPRVLAIDDDRAWMLMADGGTALRERLDSAQRRARWEHSLTEFARFQIATSGAVARLIALGCPDLRLERVPEQYARLVADEAALMVGRPGGLTAEELARARAMEGEVEAICAELARLGLPATIQHDDLGPGNLLLDAAGNTIFFDWSDSSVAHPLLSCYIPLRWSRYLLAYDQPALDRLRDAYLEPWTAYATRPDLLAAFPLACRLAKLSRALTWHRFVSGMEPEARWEFEDAVPYFLRMFLDDDEGDD